MTAQRKRPAPCEPEGRADVEAGNSNQALWLNTLDCRLLDSLPHPEAPLRLADKPTPQPLPRLSGLPEPSPLPRLPGRPRPIPPLAPLLTGRRPLTF